MTDPLSQFPSAIDDPLGLTRATPSIDPDHTNAADLRAIAVQRKVGIDLSRDPTSLDYRVRALEARSGSPDWQSHVRAAAVLTATQLAAFFTYDAGDGTLTTVDNLGALDVDDVALIEGQDVLVALTGDDGAPSGSASAGIFRVSTLGAVDPGGSPVVLTRRTDAATSGQLRAGAQVRVTEGTLYGRSTWDLSAGSVGSAQTWRRSIQNWERFAVDTADATTVTVRAIPLAAGQGVLVEASGSSTAGSDQRFTQSVARFRRKSGGNVELVGSVARTDGGGDVGLPAKPTDAGGISIDLVADTGSESVQVRFTGRSATDIHTELQVLVQQYG